MFSFIRPCRDRSNQFSPDMPVEYIQSLKATANIVSRNQQDIRYQNIYDEVECKQR